MGLMPKEQALAAEIDQEFSAELLQEENMVEALLFTLGRSVSVEEIAIALQVGAKPAESAAERLLKKYEERQGGILIQRLEGRYQMCTNPKAYEGLIRVVKEPKKPVLTDVVLETLAIIAYKQPVTKAEIERIRGVKSDHAVNRLVEYELVYEAGRLDAPGRPALFCTTEEFLRRFGVESLKELPALSEEAEKAIESEVSEEIADILGEEEAEQEDTEATEEAQAKSAQDALAAARKAAAEEEEKKAKKSEQPEGAAEEEKEAAEESMAAADLQIAEEIEQEEADTEGEEKEETENEAKKEQTDQAPIEMGMPFVQIVQEEMDAIGAKVESEETDTANEREITEEPEEAAADEPEESAEMASVEPEEPVEKEPEEQPLFETEEELELYEQMIYEAAMGEAESADPEETEADSEDWPGDEEIPAWEISETESEGPSLSEETEPAYEAVPEIIPAEATEGLDTDGTVEENEADAAEEFSEAGKTEAPAEEASIAAIETDADAAEETTDAAEETEGDIDSEENTAAEAAEEAIEEKIPAEESESTEAANAGGPEK